jgi:CubicO group peptidase (beta-lactamase class C family)
MPDLHRDDVLDACRYLDGWLAYRLAAERVPGVQAAVLHGDEVVLSSAHGVSSVVTGEPLRDDHLFRIASHSKTFTATAVMQLVERGDLRLDDTVGERLADLASSPIASVTLRELLAHGGGVIRDGHDGDFWQLGRPFPGRDELMRITADASDVLPRNDRFKYSNVGYSVLGLVIEQVSGQPYGDYIREHIIDRLGLHDIGPDYDPARSHRFAGGHTALGYADSRIPIEHVDTAAMASATGCFATASDLVRYAAAHFAGDERLVSDASKRQMQHPHWKVLGTDEEYGLGFQVATVGKRLVFGHGGGYPGHITRTYFDPADRLAVSVLTNAIDGPAAAWAAAALKLVDLAVAGRVERTDDADTTTRATFCGRFASLWGVFDIVDLGGRLHQLSPATADPTAVTTKLDLVDADTLRIAETPGYGSPGERMRFERDGAGAVVSVRAGSGMTAYPIEAYRAAVASRSMVSVGEPIVP